MSKANRWADLTAGELDALMGALITYTKGALTKVRRRDASRVYEQLRDERIDRIRREREQGAAAAAVAAARKEWSAPSGSSEGRALIVESEADRIRREMIESGQPERDLERATERWNGAGMIRDFIVHGFAAPYVIVTRRSDGVVGTLEFTHSPRWYFNFLKDE